MVLLGPPGERVLVRLRRRRRRWHRRRFAQNRSASTSASSNSFDLFDSERHGVLFGEFGVVRGHCCEVFAGTFREVLPSGLAAHSERIADLIPARPGVAGGCDLFVAHVVELGLRTCEFAQGVERVGRKGVGG